MRYVHCPVTVIKWKEIYEKLGAAVDGGEKVVNSVESFVAKDA